MSDSSISMSSLKTTQLKNLATRNVADFTITPDGEAYISQRKAAELCGVTRNPIVHFFNGKSDISQGISANDLQIVVQHYAEKGRPEAVKTLIQFSKAGAKAYIYHEAGYELQAVQQQPHQFKLPQNYVEALESLVAVEKEKIVLTRKVEEMQPKADGFDRIANADGTMTISDAAKQLDMKPHTLFAWMAKHRWIFKRGTGKNDWVPYQPKINVGLMTDVASENGGCTYAQSRVTAKGLAKLSNLLNKEDSTKRQAMVAELQAMLETLTPDEIDSINANALAKACKKMGVAA